MPVRLTAAARADLIAIRAHLGQDNPAPASRGAVALQAACDRLEHLPERGRPGRVAGTREVAALWPYLVIHRVTAQGVDVPRIWHGARERP